jgi:hypothetical protein
VDELKAEIGFQRGSVARATLLSAKWLVPICNWQRGKTQSQST